MSSTQTKQEKELLLRLKNEEATVSEVMAAHDVFKKMASLTDAERTDLLQRTPATLRSLLLEAGLIATMTTKVKKEKKSKATGPSEKKFNKDTMMLITLFNEQKAVATDNFIKHYAHTNLQFPGMDLKKASDREIHAELEAASSNVAASNFIVKQGWIDLCYVTVEWLRRQKLKYPDLTNTERDELMYDEFVKITGRHLSTVRGYISSVIPFLNKFPRVMYTDITMGQIKEKHTQYEALLTDPDFPDREFWSQPFKKEIAFKLLVKDAKPEEEPHIKERRERRQRDFEAEWQKMNEDMQQMTDEKTSSAAPPAAPPKPPRKSGGGPVSGCKAHGELVCEECHGGSSMNVDD